MRLALNRQLGLRTAHRRTLFDRLALLRSRRALATLTDAQLQDINITRQEALIESKKGIWDAPGWWKAQ